MAQTEKQSTTLLAIDPKLPMAPQIYGSIRQSILDLRLTPKQALSEKELALMLGVSRTPVREALIKLSEDGLVDIFPQRGTFVAPIRVAEVLEAQFIREALEVSVVGRVAEISDPAIIARLQESLARQKRAVDNGDLDGFLAEDENFHFILSASVNLTRAWKVIQNVKGQLDRVRVLSLPEPGHLAELYEQHQAIVTSIKSGNAAAAKKHMTKHLQQVFRTIDKLLARRPEIFFD
ncbi:GntR family transcriptional regulator (plasmid) [Rhizobium lusitanum]|uniref:GntR family transcriptional regulator n=1 Tax=Rhizobium lusitanum TaxID=293958 RepID=UPI00161400EE|nr:GntR family transcriptional regulator [Rhizobium lusitanum]QND45674.1 GntR family transcriptional regulator [Rhizobium lusitanum]